MQDTPRLIGIPEVTRITSLHKTSIYEFIKSHELRPIKIGRSTRFLESEIFEFVNKRVAARA
jgi:excisionase family DNA binding protein